MRMETMTIWMTMAKMMMMMFEMSVIETFVTSVVEMIVSLPVIASLTID